MLPDFAAVEQLSAFMHIYLNFSLLTNFFLIYLIILKCIQFKLHSEKTQWVKGYCIDNIILDECT